MFAKIDFDFRIFIVENMILTTVAYKYLSIKRGRDVEHEV